MIARFALPLMLIFCALAVHGVRADAPSTQSAYRADPGPLAVAEFTRIKLHDPKLNKDLPLYIAAPTTGGPYPVIIFSHGAGGSGQGYSALLKYWASYGYICIAPTHADSLALAQHRAFQLSDLLHEVHSIEHDTKAWQNRVRNIVFVMDSLPDIETAQPELKGKLDAGHLGVGGHSFGAQTSMLIGGATIDLPDRQAATFADARAQAILCLSSQGPGGLGLDEHSWDHFSLPLMIQTGSRDRGAGNQGPDWRMQPYQLSPEGDKYAVFIEGANHFSFTGFWANDSAGDPGGAGSHHVSPEQQRIFNYVRISTLAFWDAYLKDDPAAKAYLHSTAMADLSDNKVMLSAK